MTWYSGGRDKVVYFSARNSADALKRHCDFRNGRGYRGNKMPTIREAPPRVAASLEIIVKKHPNWNGNFFISHNRGYSPLRVEKPSSE